MMNCKSNHEAARRLFSLVVVLALSAGCVESSEPSVTKFNERYASMDRTLDGLDAYARESRSLHKQAAGTGAEAILTTITLRSPTTPEAAEAFIRRHEVDPAVIYAFAKDSSGAVSTIMVKKKGSIAKLRDLAEHNEAEFLGVVAIVGNVNSSRIAAVDADPVVFLADISADHNFAPNPGNVDYMPSFAWDLFHANISSATQSR